MNMNKMKRLTFKINDFVIIERFDFLGSSSKVRLG